MYQRNLSVKASMLPALFSACAILLTPAAGARGDSPGKPEEDIKKLIVMIRSTRPDGLEEAGAGIIFSQQGNNLYAVTANHVVRQGLQQNTNVRVQLRWLPGETLPAQLLDDADPSMDWAVLKVPNVDPSGLAPEGLPFAQLGDARSVHRGDKVFLIGNPAGHPWEINVTPVGVTGNAAESIFFESSLLEPGHSGGALLDDHMGVVGLLKSSQAPHGEALNIQSVLSILEDRGYVMSVKPRENAPPAAPSAPSPAVEESKNKRGANAAAMGARDCSFGPDTCIQGFVWREAVPSDHVCVLPQVRDQTRSDNAQAAARRSPTGGPYGPDTCLTGFVWRDAFQGDHVCVTPQARSQAAQDNSLARSRKACP